MAAGVRYGASSLLRFRDGCARSLTSGASSRARYTEKARLTRKIQDWYKVCFEQTSPPRIAVPRIIRVPIMSVRLKY